MRRDGFFIAILVVAGCAGLKTSKSKQIYDQREAMPPEYTPWTEDGVACAKQCPDKRCFIGCVQDYGGVVHSEVGACVKTKPEEECLSESEIRSSRHAYSKRLRVPAAYEPLNGEGNSCRTECLQLASVAWGDCFENCAKFHGGEYRASIEGCERVSCGDHGSSFGTCVEEPACRDYQAVLAEAEVASFPAPKNDSDPDASK